MRFEPTKLSGAFVVEPEPHEDSRGSFARTFCAREFAERGLASVFVQSSISFNHKRGTLRGLHYQLPPEVFQHRTFTRLKQLEYLIRTKQIDGNFFWNEQEN